MGSNDNNEDQFIDDFDDMTFDDMDFDDEPMQESQTQNNPNNIGVNSETNNVDTGEYYNNVVINSIGNFGTSGKPNNKKQKAPKAPKTPKQPKAPKAPKAPKTPKQPKAPKAPKAPKTPKKKLFNKKAKQLDNNMIPNVGLDGVNVDEKQPIDKKKLNIIIGCSVLFVIILALVLFLNRTTNKDKHLIAAEPVPEVTLESTEDTKQETEEEEEEEEEEVEDTNEPTVTQADLKFGETYDMHMVVNTKTADDTEYTDHEALLKMTYSNYVAGYDNVKEYIDKYNELVSNGTITGANKINISDKDTFYASSIGNDLVMYEFELNIPEDFPTNDEKHGYTGITPIVGLTIAGTDKEDALLTDVFEYEIPSVTYIGDDISSLTVGNTYKLRFITTMPVGLDASGYKLVLTYDNTGDITEFNVETKSIEENPDVISYKDNAGVVPSADDVDISTKDEDTSTKED